MFACECIIYRGEDASAQGLSGKVRSDGQQRAEVMGRRVGLRAMVAGVVAGICKV